MPAPRPPRTGRGGAGRHRRAVAAARSLDHPAVGAVITRDGASWMRWVAAVLLATALAATDVGAAAPAVAEPVLAHPSVASASFHARDARLADAKGRLGATHGPQLTTRA